MILVEWLFSSMNERECLHRNDSSSKYVAEKLDDWSTQRERFADARRVVEITKPEVGIAQCIWIMFADRLVAMALNVHRKVEVCWIGHRVAHMFHVPVYFGVRDHLAEAYVSESHPVNEGLSKVIRRRQGLKIVDVGVDFGINTVKPRKSLRVESR